MEKKGIMTRLFCIVVLMVCAPKIYSADHNIYSFETGALVRSGGCPVAVDDPLNAWRTHAYAVVTHPKTNEKLHMVPVVPGHYRHMLMLASNPHIMDQSKTQQPYAFPKDRFEAWVKRGDEGKPTWWFIFKGDKVTEKGFIGAAGSYIDPKTAFVNVRGFGLPEFWNKGYASTIFPKMLSCIDTYMVEGYGDFYNGFDATPHATNIAAHKILTKAGFQQEGDVFQNKAGHPCRHFVLWSWHYVNTIPHE